MVHFHDAIKGLRLALYEAEVSHHLEGEGIKVTPRLKEAIKLLQGIDFSKESDVNRGLALRLLKRIDRRQAADGSPDLESITNLGKTLLKLESLESSHSKTAPPSPQSPPPTISTIAYFCDADSRNDPKSVISSIMTVAVNKQIPFITSRSILSGSTTDIPLSQKSLLLGAEDDWEIYVHADPTYHEELVVFIPKSLSPDSSSKDRLEMLDLKTDRTLRKISIKDACSGPEAEADARAFSEIFVDSPAHPKLFYVAGHGGVGSPAGMTAEHYMAFLETLKKNQCQGLMVTSCYSGGKSVLPYLSNPEMNEEGVDFPVLVESIGDYPAKESVSNEEPRGQMLDTMKELVTTPGGRSYGMWRSKLSEARSMTPQNRLQVYFPHSSRSPGGIRDFMDDPKVESITMTSLKQVELTHSKSEGFTVTDKERCYIYPLVVESPIFFKQKNPVLLSMIPGKSHQYLAEVHLFEQDPEEWVQNSGTLHQEWEVGVQKCFFFGKIAGKSEIWQHVAFDPKSGHCIFQNDGDWFFRTAGKITPISSWQAFFTSEQMRGFSKGDSKAVSSATASLQNEELFLDQLLQNSPFDEEMQLLSISKVVGLKDDEIEAILPTFDAMSLEDKEELLIFLILAGKDDWIIPLMERDGHIPPNITDYRGFPILLHSAKRSNVALTQYLLSKGADVNTPGSVTTPLHLAVANSQEGQIEVLLQSPSIDIEAKNVSGETPIFSANEAQIPILLKHGQQIDTLNTNGATALCKATQFYSKERIQALIDAGADVNIGRPSPLTLAVRRGEMEIIELLLEGGANPFEKDASGHIPFLESLFRGTLGQVQMLITHPNCNLLQLDDNGHSALTISLCRGSNTILDLVLDHGGLPKEFPEDGYPMLEDASQRILQFKDFESIERVVKKCPESSGRFCGLLFCAAAEMEPSFAYDLLDRGLVDLNALYMEGETIFEHLAYKALTYMPELLPVIQTCMTKGAADIDVELQNGKKLILVAIDEGNRAIVRLLVDCDLDVKPYFSDIIRLGDLELLQLCFEKGCDFNAPDAEGKYPIQKSCSQLYSENGRSIFRWLIKKGATLSNLNEEELHHMFRCVAIGKDKECQKMLTKFPELFSSEAFSTLRPEYRAFFESAN